MKTLYISDTNIIALTPQGEQQWNDDMQRWIDIGFAYRLCFFNSELKGWIHIFTK